jgi:hypothetical protein
MAASLAADWCIWRYFSCFGVLGHQGCLAVVNINAVRPVPLLAVTALRLAACGWFATREASTSAPFGTRVGVVLPEWQHYADPVAIALPLKPTESDDVGLVWRKMHVENGP